MKKSVLNSVLKSVTFVILFSASFSVFGQCTAAQDAALQTCTNPPTWKEGKTWKKGKIVKYKFDGKNRLYKANYNTRALLTDSNNRCEDPNATCYLYWKRVCVCPSSSARMETGEEGSFSEESEMESNNLAYPNPFTSNLNVRASVNASSAEVSIMNLIGERVLTNNVATENGKVNTTFDTGNLASGMYIVQITAGEEVITYKVSK